MGTVANPGKDCHSQALPHEERFTLLGRDPAAPNAIRLWVDERVDLGKNRTDDDEIQEALACADRMDAQRAAIRTELGKPVEVEQVEENDDDDPDEEFPE